MMITIYTKEEGKVTYDLASENIANMSYNDLPTTLHREDGPAVEYSSGSRDWFQHGKRHRLDGPACEYTKNEWWIDDQQYTEEDFNKIIEEAKQLPPELKLTDPRWWVREMK
jgi:hypothetical protein